MAEIQQYTQNLPIISENYSLKNTYDFKIYDSWLKENIATFSFYASSSNSLTNKNIKLSKPPVLLTLPDVPTPTSVFYTKDFYIKKIDIIKEINMLLGKNIKYDLFEKNLHDVPDLKFKGPF